MATKPRLREKILDKAAQKDLELADIIKGADFPGDYLEIILEHDTARAPAFPYIRLHLINLAEFLGLDPKEITNDYKEEFVDKISGSHDKLPSNRFSLPSPRKKLIITISAVLIAIMIYLFISSGFSSNGIIHVSFPPEAPSPFIVDTSTINLTGQIDPSDKLMINGQVTPVSDDGLFEESYVLNPEINFIEFKIKRLLADDIIIIREIYFDSTRQEEPIIIPLFFEKSPSSTEELLQSNPL